MFERDDLLRSADEAGIAIVGREKRRISPHRHKDAEMAFQKELCAIATLR